MKLPKAYKYGLLNVAVILLLLASLIYLRGYCCFSSNFNFIVDQKAEDFLSQQKQRQSAVTSFKYDVNNITSYQAYILGIDDISFYKLQDFLKKGNLIYNLNQFQEVTNLDSLLLDSIAADLRFPKKNISTKKYLKKPKVLVVQKEDINTVTSEKLFAKDKLPSVIANRIVKYRKYLGGYSNMSQLAKVYDILPKHLEILNQNYKVVK